MAKFGRMVEDVKAGRLDPERFRAFRVPQGVYEQRRDGSYMVRVRIPGGKVSPVQMRVLADAAKRYGEGPLHVTTRKDFQIHNVPLENIQPALVLLQTAGLSAKGGGGNTVRNITACPYAGVCADELFDVTPHAAALTEYLLADSRSFQLPRKYKIAFSGCPCDCAGGLVNDVGFIARLRNGAQGFAVYAGGGMGANPAIGHLLEEFVPEGAIHVVAEAVKRVFDKFGNRRNKHRARLRYLVSDMGFERFVDLYRAEKEALAADAQRLGSRTQDAVEPIVSSNETVEPKGNFEAWQAVAVRPQKQAGFHIVDIPLELGDIAPDTLVALAEVVEKHGDRCLRSTQSQNLAMTWIRRQELPALHRALDALGLAVPEAPWFREMVACAGASTCRLGICLSRGVLRAIRKEIRKRGLGLPAARDLRIYVNGCPNSCARHPVASLGLVGAARRSGSRLVPCYVVKLGGRLGEGTARLADGSKAVPARNAPAFVADLLAAFKDSASYPDFGAFLENGGRERADRLLDEYASIPEFEENPAYYYDWGAQEVFSLAGRGPGECSAGVFDLIEIDLATAKEALERGTLRVAAAAAARALLVTRGEEAENDRQAYDLFHRHFIETGLLTKELAELVASLRDGDESVVPERNRVAGLVAAVRTLYDTMDQSLRFRPPAETAGAQGQAAGAVEAGGISVDKEADFQGVTCPLNYVKTKLLLEGIRKGQVLAVLLDEAGGKNVPESARQNGHEVLSVSQEDGRWCVVIKKT